MNKTVLITIHGILTNTDSPKAWQNKFAEWLKDSYPAELTDKSLIHMPFSYGLIGPVWAFILHTMAWAGLARIVSPFAVQKFKKFLKAVAKNYPEYDIHIIGHSFGTWVSHTALQELSGRIGMVLIKSVTYFGAVVSAHIQRNYLDELLMSKQLDRCVMWSSHNDTVVRFLAVPPFGHAGYWGIIRDFHPEDRVKPAWKPYDHIELYNRVADNSHTEGLTVERFPLVMEDILNGPKA